MQMRIVVLLLATLLVAAPALAQINPQADVIIAVDNSGSMAAYAPAIEASLNNFAAIIQGASVDLRVILISASDDIAAGLCIPSPLGSGACPGDEKLPGFRHVTQAIGSNDALSKIQTTQPQWAGSLRSTARKFIIVVSDDDSDLPASAFHAGMLGQPGFSNYVFHGIVQGSPACGLGGVTGVQYLQLINMTGGLHSNLCSEAIATGLGRIAEAIADQAGLPDTFGCDIQMNQASYVNGNTVIAQLFGFSNGTQSSAAVEIKTWLEIPGFAPLVYIRAGADGSIVFPSGFNINAGPRQLFTITSQFPRGTYAFSCRLVNPVTGAFLAEDLTSFVVN
jgi:hypothetical protein